jgi:hypothetical protein
MNATYSQVLPGCRNEQLKFLDLLYSYINATMAIINENCMLIAHLSGDEQSAAEFMQRHPENQYLYRLLLARVQHEQLDIQTLKQQGYRSIAYLVKHILNSTWSTELPFSEISKLLEPIYRFSLTLREEDKIDFYALLVLSYKHCDNSFASFVQMLTRLEEWMALLYQRESNSLAYEQITSDASYTNIRAGISNFTLETPLLGRFSSWS